MSEITVFDFVNQILQGNSKGKQIELTEDNEELYNQYIINKALSFHRDCLFQVNMMNLYPNINSKMHFDFLLNTTRKYKRPFKPWIKPDNSEKVELIRQFFNISKREAIEIEDLVCEEDVEKIKQELNVGGISNDKRT
jgi:hypothetical protein